jgi:hypothetical protein
MVRRVIGTGIGRRLPRSRCAGRPFVFWILSGDSLSRNKCGSPRDESPLGRFWSFCRGRCTRRQREARDLGGGRRLDLDFAGASRPGGALSCDLA